MTTNNDPSVILLPYLLSVLQNNGTAFHCKAFCTLLCVGCPSIVRSDHGTENTILAACHMALRHDHNDEFNGEKSFRFGSSTTNTVELNLSNVVTGTLWYVTCVLKTALVTKLKTTKLVICIRFRE